MLNGLGQSTGIPTTITVSPSQFTGIPTYVGVTPPEFIPNLYPTAPFVPDNYGMPAPSSSGGSIPAAVIQAAVAAGLTPTAFTQQAVNAGYSPTQWAAMAAAQRQAALQSGPLTSGAPSGLTAANMTPILLIGGAVLLFVMMRK